MRFSKLKIILCLIFLRLFFSTAQAEVLSFSDAEPPKIPIDLLEEKIFKKKTDPQIKSLMSAYQSFKKDHLDDALPKLERLKSSGNLQDYAHWILGEIYFKKASASFKKKSYSETKKHVEKVLAETAQVSIKNPYTPLNRYSSVLQGKAESMAASAHFLSEKNKKRASKEVVEIFERSLKRLSDAVALDEFKLQSLEHFSESCHLAPSELCYQWVQQLSIQYPKNSRELRVIAKFFPSAVDAQKFKTPFYGKMTQTYRSLELDVQSFDPAMKAYLDGKHKDAIELFSKFLDEFPRSYYRYRAKYWLAQSLKKIGEDDRSKKLFLSLQQESPLTYYGLLSSLTSEVGVDTTIDGSLPLASNYDPTLLPEELVQIKRAEEFLAAGAFELASKELSEIKIRSSLSSPFLMYLSALQSLAEAHRSSFKVLSELIQRGYDRIFSSYVIRLIFPMKFEDLIEKYAKQYDLDPILVLSLMKQESAFDDTATSISGALGLMQIMPATAVDTESDVLKSELTDPETNIRVGTKYLKKLIQRFDGNFILALAGYNAGPNAADRWFKASNAPKNPAEFIESIPYKETREYVASIIRNYFWYAKKLQGEMPKSLDYFWNIYGPKPKTETTLLVKDPNSELNRKVSAEETTPAISADAPKETKSEKKSSSKRKKNKKS